MSLFFLPSHPLSVTSAKRLGQESHRRPMTPGRHLHWPTGGSKRMGKKGNEKRNNRLKWLCFFVCAGNNHLLSHSLHLFLLVGRGRGGSFFLSWEMLAISGQLGGVKSFSYLFSLTGKGVTLWAKRARQVAITVETFLLVDRLVVIFL